MIINNLFSCNSESVDLLTDFINSIGGLIAAIVALCGIVTPILVKVFRKIRGEKNTSRSIPPVTSINLNEVPVSLLGAINNQSTQTDLDIEALLRDAEILLNHSVNGKRDTIQRAKEMYSQVADAAISDYRGWLGLIKCTCYEGTEGLGDIRKRFDDIESYYSYIENTGNATKIDKEYRKAIENLWNWFVQDFIEAKDKLDTASSSDVKSFIDRYDIRFISFYRTMPIALRQPFEEAISDICNRYDSILADDRNETHFLFDYDNGTIRESLGRESAVTIPAMIKNKPVTAIGSKAFKHKSHIKSVVISDGIIEIGDEAFEYCSRLISINFPNTLKRIGNSALLYCSSLTSLELPTKIQAIGAYAFAYCESVQDVTLSGTLERIEEGLFKHCKGLKEIHIGEGTKVIEKDAFSGCSSLVKIFLPSSIEEIDDDAFQNVSKEFCIISPKNAYVENYAKQHQIMISRSRK